MKFDDDDPRCGCRSCGLKFASVRVFEKHRVGEFSHQPPDYGRRCLTTAEFTARGMEPDTQGYWRTVDFKLARANNGAGKQSRDEIDPDPLLGRPMRYSLRRDDNEGEIEQFLNAHGFMTWTVDGCPFDMIVWTNESPGFLLLECKTRHGRLTKQQRTFFAQTVGKPRVAVKSAEEALAAAQAALRPTQLDRTLQAIGLGT